VKEAKACQGLYKWKKKNPFNWLRISLINVFFLKTGMISGVPQNRRISRLNK
jgi:hypothetical protein